MGYRLSKIYTRIGDQGMTDISKGKRVSKADLRIDTMGEIDELNSALGVVLADANFPKPLQNILSQIQQDLFNIGGELSWPEACLISEDQVLRIEQEIDQWNSDLPFLKEFILPGGHSSAAKCHLARTICRRAERSMVRLQEKESINPAALKYINRLSDLLFVLARTMNRLTQTPEIFWNHTRKKV